MKLFEDTNPRTLKELFAEVHSHTMALSDFQRDFVWEPGATHWEDDNETFLVWRQERLWQEIRKVTGLAIAADLEAGEEAF